MTQKAKIFFLFLLLFASCQTDKQRNANGGLKEEACTLSKKLVAGKVKNRNIRFESCGTNNVIFYGNSRYEVNSYIELPEPSGKWLRYNYFVTLAYKGGDAGKAENWNVEKLFIEVFAD